MSLQKFIEGKFKRLFAVSDFDWCKFMSKDFRKSSPTVKIILDAIKDSTSGSLLHQCPYFGEHKANITIKKSVVILSPAGLYKISLLAHNPDDPEIIAFVAVVEIKASWRYKTWKFQILNANNKILTNEYLDTWKRTFCERICRNLWDNRSCCDVLTQIILLPDTIFIPNHWSITLST